MSLIKNATYNMIYQVVNILIPIIIVPYISRIVGSAGIGEYSYTNSYVQYFIIIGMLGISLYGNRQIAYLKNDNKKISKEFCNIFTLQLICNGISLIVYLTIFVFLNKSNKLLYLAQSINLLASAFDISWFFIGYEEMKTVVIRNTLVKVIGVIFIFIFVKNSNDIILYTLILSLSLLLGQLIMWISLSKIIIFSKPEISQIKKHLGPALILFLSQLAIQMYVLVDKTMLGIIRNASEVGYYENSQKTIKLALTLATSVGIVMLPRMSNLYYQKKKKEFRELMYKSFSFTNLISMPIFIGLVSIADGFSPWFYGPSFNGIQNLIKVGAIIIIPISISNVLGMQVLLPIGKEKQFTVSIFIGLIVNIVINIFTIRELGALGATISSVISEFSITLIQLYFLRGFVSVKNILKSLKNPLIGSIIMFFIVYPLSFYLNIGMFGTIIEVLIGFLVYFIVIYMLKDKFLFDAIILLKKKLIKI